MSLHRGIDGSEPLRPEPVTRLAPTHEPRRDARVWKVATGTLACPECDAPVAPHRTMAPRDPLGCPYCGEFGRVRDFLSLSAPSRPARVAVRIVQRVRLPRRA